MKAHYRTRIVRSNAPSCSSIVPINASPSPQILSRLSIILGSLWILFGFAANEWTISFLLSINKLGPLSRSFIWVLDFTMISCGALTILYPFKAIIHNGNLLLVTITSLIVSVECGLRLFPTVLGQEFANGVLTKYTTQPDGIYYMDPVLRMNFMIPNHRTEMYYNGYTWIHQTDAFGFRNSDTKNRADMILLGDSMIYGHGLAIDQTVGYLIEKFTGLSVVNLARQGDTSLQQSYLLTENIEQFNPRYVLYLFLENDIRDLYECRTDEELREFIDRPISEIEYKRGVDVEAGIKMRDDAWRAATVNSRLREKVYLFKVLNWIERRRRNRAIDARISDKSHDINDEGSIGWKYTKKAIKYMDSFTKSHHAQFIIVPITPWNKRHHGILKKFAGEEKIAFIDSETIIDGSDESLFLPRDGHFSEKGARTMAQVVAEYLEHLRR